MLAALLECPTLSYNLIMGRLTDGFTVRLDEETRLRLDHIAKTLRRSRGEIVREILANSIEEYEHAQRINERAALIRTGKIATRSLADVGAELQLESAPNLEELR